MPYRKLADGTILEYREITINIYTPEQFEAKITKLDAEVKKDPAVLGTEIIADNQVKLDELKAVNVDPGVIK
jgi:hypothetical protein